MLLSYGAGHELLDSPTFPEMADSLRDVPGLTFYICIIDWATGVVGVVAHVG